MKRVLLSTLLILNLCGSIDLAAAGPFTGLVVFGDSLSDVGNVQQRTTQLVPLVQPIPGPSYFNGRFSNGPNYADVLSQGAGARTVEETGAKFSLHSTDDEAAPETREKLASPERCLEWDRSQEKLTVAVCACCHGSLVLSFDDRYRSQPH